MIQSEPTLITDQTWFNDKVAQFKISKVRLLGENFIPANVLSTRLFYVAVFDTMYQVQDVESCFDAEISVNWSEPNYIYQPFITSNDDWAESMWGLDKLALQQVWNMGEYGDPSIIVAVLDTGIDLGLNNYQSPHLDLSGFPQGFSNIWVSPDGNYGFNPFSYEADDPLEHEFIPHDRTGHGTHVSGTIAAINNNNEGVVGIAGGWWTSQSPGCKVMPIKCGDHRWIIDTAIYEGLLYAYRNGAKVINMSFGGLSQSILVTNAVQTLYNDLEQIGNCPLMIAAAGNIKPYEGTSSIYGDSWVYPARYDEVISVSASDIEDVKASYSCFGSHVEIPAPGGTGYLNPQNQDSAIVSTSPMDTHFFYHTDESNLWPSDYAFTSGTSMAAPHVVALILSYNQHNNITITNEEVKQRLLGTADDIYGDNLIYANELGAGRLNAYRALTEEPHPSVQVSDFKINNQHQYTIDYAHNHVYNTTLEVSSTAINNVSIALRNLWINAENVIGNLTSDDPYVTFSYGSGLDHSIWGDISANVSIYNSIPIFLRITDGPSRQINFTLSISGDNMPLKTIDFQLQVNNIYGSITDLLEQGEQIQQHNVCKDINFDGFDEIVMYTNLGQIFIVDSHNGGRIRTSRKMECPPALGDIDSDGEYEIVCGTADDADVNHIVNNDVLVYKPDGTLDYHISVEGKVINITLEDVNGDGQLDIIAGLRKDRDNYGIDGLVVINTITQQSYIYNTGYRVQSSLSVGDVDNDGVSEIALVCKNQYNLGQPVQYTSLFLKVFDISSDFLSITEVFNAIQNATADDELTGSPVIADLDSNGLKEVLYSYGTKLPSGFNSNIIAYSYGNTIPIWQHLQNSAVGQMILSDIVVGEFNDLSQGLEVFYISKDMVLLSSQGNSLFNQSHILSNTSPCILSFDYDSNDVNDFVVVDRNGFIVLDQSLNQINTFELQLGSDYFNGASFMKTGYNGNSMALTSSKGQPMLFPAVYNPDTPSFYRQHLFNSRHTGYYTQPVPDHVRQNCTIKHDVYLEYDLIIDSRISIQPGVHVVVDPQKFITVIGELSAIGAENNLIQFRGTCYSSTPGYWSRIDFRNNSKSTLSYNMIENAKYGLLYQEFGKHNLIKSILTNNSYGVGIYNGSPILYRNNIYNNTQSGICLFHDSSPYMGLYSPERSGKNALYQNPTGLFSHRSTPLLREGHNDFDNDIWNIFTEETHAISAELNWWGSSQSIEFEDKFNEPQNIHYTPWDINPNILTDPDPQIVFNNAIQIMLEEQYFEAIPLFLQVLNDSVESEEDYISVKSLLLCYEKTSNLVTYESYLQQQLSGSPSESMRKCFEECLALVKRLLEQYNVAIAFYENILDNDPPADLYACALIDIGNTYLESDNKASGKYSNLRPNSLTEHLINSRRLLESLVSIDYSNSTNNPVPPLTLYQNYPNPFNPTTTIRFSTPNDAIVVLTIYNIKGQQVRTLVNNSLQKGVHTYVWNGLDQNNRPVGSGIYFYKVACGKLSVVKKCLLLK